MNTCALTRVLWPAFLVGLLVGSLAGNDTWGWVAAGLVAGSIYAVQRARWTNRTCPIPQSDTATGSTSELAADEHRGSAAR
jgi:hypothetical protein